MYDLIVIGGGPGGYVGAIRAAQLGLKVACIEERKTLGGTCLNVGCIPSKALLELSEKYYDLKTRGESFGFEFQNLSLNLKKMFQHKDDVVKSLTSGIDHLFAKNKIDRIEGMASLAGEGKVRVADQVLVGKNILIATGSKSISLSGIEVDEKLVVSSTGALNLNEVPRSMIVIGGGYIGLELGSVWARLGSEVTIVEAAPRLVPQMDGDISLALKKSLEKQGIKFMISQKLQKLENLKTHVKITLEDGQVLPCDVALMSVGRAPRVDGLNLGALKIAQNERGFISVDENYRTSVPNIYAIGDVIVGPMLAHKAMEEAVVCVERMMGQKSSVNYRTIPGVIYTHPEAASVGQTEEELKSLNIPYVASKSSFMANGRAKAMGTAEGFVKILAHKESDEILGVHILGPQAGTLIGEAVVAMEFRASSEDLARIIHAHPTLNEVMKEAALGAFSKPIHG